MLRFAKIWLFAALAYYTVLMILTHIPQERLGTDLGVFNLDKLLHVVAYAILTFLLAKACAPTTPLQLRYVLPLVLVLAALDEWTQVYVGRTCSLADYSADIIGVGCVIVGQWIVGRLLSV